MKRGLILLLAVAVFIGISTQKANAGVPQMINYQGTLTDAGGAAVANGNYNIEFKIYGVASGGTALWSEKWDTTTSQVPVVGGIFNVMLGFQNPIPASFFADNPVSYLGIKVGIDSEMLPRQQITSVGYAFTAGNGVPKGGIIMWSGTINAIPAGWALCDGVERTLPDGSKITPPNLKDRFVIGAGSGYAVGASGGEATHILTVNEMPIHTHIQYAHTHIQDAHTHIQNSHTHIVGGDSLSRTTGGSSFYGVVNASGDSPMTSGSTTATNQNSTATNQNFTATNQNAGGGVAQNNLPPYYALAFIIKL